MLLGIFKIALPLIYRHVFMRQSPEILKDFNTLTETFSEKGEPFSKIWNTIF